MKTARAARTAADTVHELAEHYKALRVGLTVSQSSAADSSGTMQKSKPSPGIPLRLDYADEAKRLDAIVAQVARDLRTERGLPHRPVPDRAEQRSVWLTRSTAQPVCELRQVKIITYGTVVTLRAIPPLLDAVGEVEAEIAVEVLEEARRDARAVLQFDEPPVHLDDFSCPECRGRDLLHQALAALLPEPIYVMQWPVFADVPTAPSLLALPLEGEVWCRNRACGYECGRHECWCHEDLLRRHRYRWGRSDLLRLGAMATIAGVAS